MGGRKEIREMREVKEYISDRFEAYGCTKIPTYRVVGEDIGNEEWSGTMRKAFSLRDRLDKIWVSRTHEDLIRERTYSLGFSNLIDGMPGTNRSRLLRVTMLVVMLGKRL
ncbi:hypothetical protein HZH68_011496 [Vespula germanica]|uniref:Uncharacterized protein n=2 Tax=Vespula TaxID=7451 RepID=A0A834N2M0_VESGE|nr:hypothetical protein HZH68_011496 [Vespula germanica]KAF7415612.1 hypothetical protein H0235_012204 [Vespula pensylvanica]